jgi:predicted RNA-binding protein YlqC (UPF0109 family)
MNRVETLAKFLISSISENAESIDVTLNSPNPNAVIVNINAPKEDIPMLIGKKGSVIRSLRSILRVLAPSENKFIDVTILEK